MAGHMVLQVWKEAAESVDGSIFPSSYIQDECPVCEHGLGHGCDCPMNSAGEYWFSEYTAPGYLDKTDVAYSKDGPIDAAYEAFGLYGNDEHGSDDRRELARFIRQARAQGYRK